MRYCSAGARCPAAGRPARLDMQFQLIFLGCVFGELYSVVLR